MPKIQLFKRTLTTAYQPTAAFAINAFELTLLWEAVVAAGTAGSIEWYLEFSDDNVKWYREVAEEDVGGGVVGMPLVVRTFKANGGAALPAGATTRMDTEFRRRNALCRVQVKASAGSVQLTLSVLDGLPVNAP